jgi:hypothetical protein
VRVASDGEGRLQVCHVLNTVGPSASPGLVEIQHITLDSIRRALDLTREDVEVRVHAARLPDDPLPADWLVDAKHLDRSVLDVSDVTTARRLPLLGDILDAADRDADLVVFSNIDIAVQPLFYEALAELHRRGHDAFTINRRTLHLPTRQPGLAGLSTMLGHAHPGTDCFVFEASMLEDLDLGEVCVGVPPVGRVLLYNLMLRAEAFREFADLHATFHLGDDRAWNGDEFLDLEVHNRRAFAEVVERLRDRWGPERVERLPGIAELVPGSGGVEAITIDAVRETRQARTARSTTGTRRGLRSHGRRRLVFAASPGRSATEHLARILGTAKRTVAHHEAAPQMSGPWLRRIAFEDRGLSYEARRVKCDALRLSLEQLPDGGIYADTSHLFVKTFADVVFDDFNHHQISVIALHRPLVPLAASMLSLGWFSPMAPAWPDWLLPPTAPESRFPIPADRVEHRLDLIVGYILDTDLRTRELRARTPEVDWIDVDIRTLKDRETVRDLLRRLGTSPTDETWESHRGSANRKAQQKRHRRVGLPAAEVRAHVATFHTRFAEEIDAAGLANRFGHTDRATSGGADS